MLKKAKIILPVLAAALFILVLIIVANGKKAQAPSNSESSGTESAGSGMEAAKTPITGKEGLNPSSVEMPAATGNANATVDAIISGAENESAISTGDGSDAVSAVDDSQDINNLKNTYDESEF